MVLASGDDVAHIARLYGIISVLVHQFESLVYMALIVQCRGRSLMVHHQFYALGVGIVVEHLDVEVGVGCHEVKHVQLGVAEPVFPALVPSFHQHLVQPIGGSKVYIALHLLIVGAVGAVGLALLVVGLPQMYRGQVIGIGPALLAYDHVPPHTAVLGRMYP